jgi:hypothetical protein
VPLAKLDHDEDNDKAEDEHADDCGGEYDDDQIEIQGQV